LACQSVYVGVPERVVDERRFAAACRPVDVEALDVAPCAHERGFFECLKAARVSYVELWRKRGHCCRGLSSRNSIGELSESSSCVFGRFAPCPWTFEAGFSLAAVSNCLSLGASSRFHVRGAVELLELLADCRVAVSALELDVELVVDGP